MWGQISGVAGQFKKTINAVASEIKDAVEEVRGSDDQPAFQSARHLGPDVPKAASAPSSVRGVRVAGTSSRLEAIKARLEAERAGASRQASGAAHELSQPPQHGHSQDQDSQTSQKAEVAASPSQIEPRLHLAYSAAQSRATQAEAGPDASLRRWQIQDMAPSSSNGPSSTGRAPAQKPEPSQGLERSLHMPRASAAAQSSPDHAERLRSQVQHLKAELMATATAHEEEEARLAENYEQRLKGAEAKSAELAGLLEKAKAASDHHARIMELQVRLKEEQAEKARLLDQLATSQTSQLPSASGNCHPEMDDNTFWEAVSGAGPAPLREADESNPGAHASSQTAELHQAPVQTIPEADEQLGMEIAAHAETRAALQGQIRQNREVEEQLHAAQAALQSEQSTRRASQEELSRAQALQAELQKGLASHDEARQHAAEAATQARQAEVQTFQAEITQAKATIVDAELQLQEEQQQHLQSLQALEEAQAGQCAAVDELERERARYAQQQDALCEVQHTANRAAQDLAQEKASHADTKREKAEPQAAVLEAQSGAAQYKDVEAILAAARAELDAERQAHAITKAEAQQQIEYAPQSATAQAAAEQAFTLRTELQQALEHSSQQGDWASKLEEELRQSRLDNNQMGSLLADLNSRCAVLQEGMRLQEELDNARHQLHDAQQDSKADLAAQLSQHEDAAKSARQESEQRLQQALQEVADLKQEIQTLRATPGQKPTLPNSNGHGSSTDPPYAKGDADAIGLRNKLAETEQDLERTKQQLQRLKQATVMRQEDEEDSVRWRVEAEVRLAVDRAQQAAAQQEAQMHKAIADLQADLAHAKEQLDGQGGILKDWRNAVAAKDLEIQNLQAALGELAYKSEAAERLRLDLRVQTAKLREAEERCHSTEQALEASKILQQALEQQLTATAQQAERQRDLEQRLSDEAAMLRRALSQSMHQLKLANSDAGAMVDRRIVTKLLLTWMERGRNDQSVLNLMASMLGFSEDEKKRFGVAQGPGIIKTVTGAPIALIKGLANSGDGAPKSKDGLADQWVEFLIEQANAADAMQPAGRSRSTSLERTE